MSTNYFSFISRTEFDKLVETHLNNMSPNRRVKAVLTREVADQAIEILNSSNTNASSKFRLWVQQTFSLTHTGKAKHLLLKKSNKPVCVRENMYDVIGSIHENLQHAGYGRHSTSSRNDTATFLENWLSPLSMHASAQVDGQC